MIKRICKGCGKEFEAKYLNQLFCDFFCRKKYKSDHLKELYRLKKEDPNFKLFIKCPVCGKEFKSTRSKKYCSEECSREHRNATRRIKDKKYRETHKNDAKPPKLNYKINGFLLKMISDNEGYHWEAYKNDKMVLVSATSFSNLDKCVKDAKLAF